MSDPVSQMGLNALRIPAEVLALLKALQLREPTVEPIHRLRDEEWARLLDFSDRANLTLKIAQLPASGFPSWVAERLKTNLADNVLRFERVKATYREATDALVRNGVEHIVIKGFTQSPDYAESARFRSQSDIDLFCPPHQIETARSVLQSIGYRESGVKISYAVADHDTTLVRPGAWKWRGNPYDPEMPLGIELHFCLWNERVSGIPMQEVEAFWERRTLREADGLVFPCLEPADQLGYFTLHILRNLFLHDWIIHHVRELAVFLHTHAADDRFWLNWLQAHSPLLRSYEAIAMFYARAWFDCRLHPIALSEVEQISATRRSWLNRFSGSAMEAMFHANKDYCWLHLGLLTSPREKWRVFRRAFIPSHIGPIGYVPLRVQNRKLIGPEGRASILQYVRYIYSLAADYARTNSVAFARVIRWSLSEPLLLRAAAGNGKRALIAGEEFAESTESV